MQELLGYTGLVKSSEESDDSKKKQEQFTALHDDDPDLRRPRRASRFLQEEIIKKEAVRKVKKVQKEKEPSRLESFGDYATPVLGSLLPYTNRSGSRICYDCPRGV